MDRCEKESLIGRVRSIARTTRTRNRSFSLSLFLSFSLRGCQLLPHKLIYANSRRALFMEREEENGRGPAVNMINFRFSSEKPAAPWEIISRRIYTAFLPIFPRSKYVWSNRMLVTNGRYRRRRSTTADFTNFPSLPVFFDELNTLPCVIALYIFHFAPGII